MLQADNTMKMWRRPMFPRSSQAAEAKHVPTPPFSTLLPKVFSAVLRPASPPAADPQPSTNPPNLEQLQTELKDLRDQFEQMKSQHKYGFVVPHGLLVWRSTIHWAACCGFFSCVPAKKLNCWWTS